MELCEKCKKRRTENGIATVKIKERKIIEAVMCDECILELRLAGLYVEKGEAHVSVS